MEIVTMEEYAEDVLQPVNDPAASIPMPKDVICGILSFLPMCGSNPSNPMTTGKN